jgi:hypothetical protein
MINYSLKILDQINVLLKEKNRPAIGLNQIVFMSGLNFLSYGKNICLASKSDFIEADQFETVFSNVLRGGPDYIRAILIPMEDSRFLIEVSFGPAKGNPSPEIFGIPDLRRTVRVVEFSK